MPLSTKTLKEFFNIIVGKFRKEIPSIDPTIKASLARASSLASAASGVSLQDGIIDAVEQMFPQTADDDFLEMIGEYDNTIRFDAQQASGKCCAPGVLNTIVPQNQTLTRNGITYIALSDASVQIHTDNVSLIFSGGIVTAVTSSRHELATGLTVIISNAVQTEYNGTFVITVIDNNTFTYELDAGALTSDNGTYESTYALIDIESQTAGNNTNIDPAGTLSISLTDIEDTAYVTADGIVGGFDQESIENYRVRVLRNHSCIPGIGSPGAVLASCYSIPGNTRVFIVRPGETSSGTPGQAGYLPEKGEAVIYILRDNDQSIIPSQSSLQETNDKIIEDGNWPTFLDDDNLYVIAPILRTQDFVFTSITPDTITMQNAIREQLDVFFEDNAEVAGTISLNDITVFLQRLQDSTGDFLTSYTLATPSSDIVANSGEIYTTGSVTF